MKVSRKIINKKGFYSYNKSTNTPLTGLTIISSDIEVQNTSAVLNRSKNTSKIDNTIDKILGPAFFPNELRIKNDKIFF